MKVEDLKHFPFKSFNEFNKALVAGDAYIGMRGHVSLDWIQSGLHSSAWLRAQTLLLAALIWAAHLGFIIYAIVAKNWWLLLAVPLLFIIAHNIFHPSAKVLYGSIRRFFILVNFIGLFWAIINHIPWLIVDCTPSTGP